MYNSSITAERIKLCAKNKKIVIKQMLDELDMNPNMINKIKGSQGIASVNLLKIAEYLEVSMDYLMGRTENPEVNK